jgi:divinyl chlorophyllide a 8-vinyl-reductase
MVRAFVMALGPSSPPHDSAVARRRVFVVGGTGYIGNAAVRELVHRGHEVVCLARPRAGVGGRATEEDTGRALAGAEVRFGDVTDAASVERDGLRGERFDAVVSCLASRTGAPADAWRIDHQANLHVLEAAKRAGARHFVLLSAICLQKPVLPFQHAKLAFEQALRDSGMTYSIVRPTAFFKSLSGQVARVKQGKRFVFFGDGRLTSCKPISEADLARFLADCLEDSSKHDAVLPIGGPGPAITPRKQAELLFELCGRPPRFRSVPVAVLDVVIAALSALGRLFPKLRDKAELARIGRYYGTESMLVLDAVTGRYEERATPSYGRDTLRDFYARALTHGLRGQELGEHAVFASEASSPPREAHTPAPR